MFDKAQILMKKERKGSKVNLKEGMELRKRSIQAISVGVGLRGLSEGNL